MGSILLSAFETEPCRVLLGRRTIMYKSLSVENFRGFESFTLRGLKRFSLLTGKNNVGKTAVLEGLFLHSGALNAPDLPLRLNLFRGLEPDVVFTSTTSPWDLLFKDLDTSHPIELKADTGQSGRISITLEVVPSEELPRRVEDVSKSLQSTSEGTASPVVSGVRVRERFRGQARENLQFITQSGIVQQSASFRPRIASTYLRAALRGTNEDVERFSNLRVRGDEGPVVEALRTIESRLREIDIIVTAGQPRLHADIGTGRMLPLHLLGEGMVRLISYVLAVSTSSEDGLVLIDEFENGIHYSALRSVWQALSSAARRRGVQIVATTHSEEMCQGCPGGDY
jgi:AAA domain, putative AbiEii toxin, Type IV TA system